MDDIQAQPLIARLDQAQLVGVNITGGDAPPVLHGDSGGEGFASRGCTGVQHPPPRLRRGGQHRQMGGGILDVKVPLLERLQVFQTSGAVQEQAVRQQGWGSTATPSAVSMAASSSAEMLRVFTWAQVGGSPLSAASRASASSLPSRATKESTSH